MIATPIRAVLFDLDGTLVHTEHVATHVILTTYASWGVTLTEQDAATITGRTWELAQELLLKRFKIPVSPEEALRTLLKGYRAQLQLGIPEVPGASQAVRALRHHWPMAVVSGSHRQEIALALQNLGITDAFQFYLGAEDYTHSKPAPDGYQAALQRLGVQPQETLIFEDSPAGIASARAAGCWVVAITSTNTLGLDQSGAHERIPDLRKVDMQWISSRPWIARR